MTPKSVSEDLEEFDSKIPVISLKEYLVDPVSGLKQVASEIDHALRHVGLFLLKDHGIEWEIIENCFRDLMYFFQMPIEKKRLYQCLNIQKGRGYIPFAAQNVNAYMGRLGYPNDALERFSFGNPKPLVTGFIQEECDYTETWSPNIYSSEPPTFRESADNCFEAMNQLSIELRRIFSFLLGEKENYLEELCSKASHMFKGQFYEPIMDPLPNQDRNALHTDIVPITILLPDQNEEGLWVETTQGQWIPAHSPPGYLMVFVGECMERMTNGYYRALPHKVPFPADKSKILPRMSLGFFPQMNSDAKVETSAKFLDENHNSKYPPVLYGDVFGLKFENLLKKTKTFAGY